MTAAALERPATFRSKKRWRRRLELTRQHGLSPFVLGLWVRRKFQRAGVISFHGGPPFPQVENRGGRIEFGNCALFSGVRLECWKDALIQVGSGTYLNRGVEIVAGRAVTIGRDCKVARDVIIMDTDQHSLPSRELVVRPVEIGDRVWIGARAIILKGVRIGNDSVIGAGAVVTRSVPANSIVVGTPARVLRSHRSES